MGTLTTIRVAGVADAPAIAEVHIATWKVAYSGLLPRHLLDRLSVQERTTGWEQVLSEEIGTTFVAVDEVNGQIVGLAGVGASRDGDAISTTGELYAIYVHPDHWDTGTGKRLHDRAIDALAGDFAEATLWVLDTNTRARQFYERHGWHADGGMKQDERADAILSEVRYRRVLGGG